MTIEYTWTIPTCEHDIDTGGITVIHWRCTGTDGDHTASSYGTVGLTPDPSAEGFTDYSGVTEAMAQAWVWDTVSQADTEEALATKLDAMANPTKASGTPWV